MAGPAIPFPSHCFALLAAYTYLLKGLSPRTCLVFSDHLVHFPKRHSLLCTGVLGTMWGAQAVLGQIAGLILSLGVRAGRKGHCEHVGALVSVIYNASTRPMVIDSMRRGPYKQPMQVSERGQCWRSRRNARLSEVCGGWEQQLGPHQWPGRCVAPPAHTRGLISVNLNLWVRWEYARRRCSSGGCVVRHYSMPFSGYRAFFWIGSMDC
jgi:hypothetical protein